MATPKDTNKPPAVGVFRAVGGRMAGIVLLALIGAVTSVVPLVAIAELAKALAPGMSGEPVNEVRVWWIVAAAAGALVVSYAAAGTSLVISHLADNDFQLDLRRRIVDQLRALPLGWFDQRSSGLVKKVAEDDVSALHQLIAHAIQDAVTSVTVPVISLAYLFAVDWRLALAALAPLVASIICFWLMMLRSFPRYQEYDASLVRLNAATIEYVHGIAVVKAFGQAGRSHGRYRREVADFVRFYDDWNRDTSRYASAGELVTSPVVVLAVISGAAVWSISAGWTAPMDALPALLLGVNLTGPIHKLAWSAQFLREASKSTKSLAEFFAQPVLSQPDNPENPTSPAVAFENVSFSYNPDHQVLKDITAQCPPGAVTALVGPSGAGKTSLARLVPRFYDATSGRVAVGGADVRAIAAERLYSQVGFVFQDTYLLATTIRDNIRLTRPGASQEQVERAARAAQIHDRIMQSPHGYDSVAFQDVWLSGGEAQRLMIARALLTDAPILVLDEATSFLDPDSEAAIQAALSALAAGRTLLVIAHRLHTVVGADQILVLDAARVAQRGRHDQLVSAGGLYQRMWEKYQAADQAEARP
ncbi:MAG: ABC transporter ATP-binding protein/permease [Bifidobacteriaceae bacterium]|jgi:ATP-binding cassette subfamily B protein|nr:ABC transporter ATP-binding protein/permease [Bifidobacteriaceae bacterium]